MTTNQTPTLDIAQLIAEAISRKNKPREYDFPEFDKENEDAIGVVPEHLRHLWDAAEEIREAMNVSEDDNLSLKTDYKLLRAVLAHAVSQHCPDGLENQDLFALRQDWVVATLHEDPSEMTGRMIMVGVGGGPPEGLLAALIQAAEEAERKA